MFKKLSEKWGVPTDKDKLNIPQAREGILPTMKFDMSRHLGRSIKSEIKPRMI